MIYKFTSLVGALLLCTTMYNILFLEMMKLPVDCFGKASKNVRVCMLVVYLHAENLVLSWPTAQWFDA